MNQTQAKAFVPVRGYNIEVLWFSQPRNHTIIYRKNSGFEQRYHHVPGTSVIIATNCLDEVHRMFAENGNKRLRAMEVIPPTCSDTLPSTIRKYCQSHRSHPNSPKSKLRFNSPKRIKILAVDDDPLMRLLIKNALSDYQITTTTSAKEALDHMSENGLPNLAILDLHMPGWSGLELGKHLHKISDIPILMATSESSQRVMIEAIEEFADDYLVKPVAPAVLKAKIGRVLDRVGDGYMEQTGPIVRAGNLQIDFVNKRALKDEQFVTLTDVENKLLYILVRDIRKQITIEFIQSRMQFKRPQYLYTYIYRLRKKLGEHCIKYEKGVGYQFVP